MKPGTSSKNHAIKTKYGFDRVVEDLIQEAMSKGDFNNLEGLGLPMLKAKIRMLTLLNTKSIKFFLTMVSLPNGLLCKKKSTQTLMT